MSTVELRFLAEAGDAWAVEQLANRLLDAQAQFLRKRDRVRQLDAQAAKYAAQHLRRRGGDAFFRCARAF